MDIVVTVKQVPNTQEVKINPKTGNLIREGIPSIINPEDENALEEAIRLKEHFKDSSVIALSMGPPQAEKALREALAMGADKAILVSDRAFAGADSLATAYILSVAIKKIKKYKLILCGRQAIDGDTAQVGPQIAEFLKLPQVTYAESIKINKDIVTVKSNFGKVIRTVEVDPPALITVTRKINTPRYKTMNAVLRSYRDKTIVTWTKDDLKINPMRIGMNGSPTRVLKTFTPDNNRDGIVKTGTDGELVNDFFDILIENNLINT